MHYQASRPRFCNVYQLNGADVKREVPLALNTSKMRANSSLFESAKRVCKMIQTKSLSTQQHLGKEADYPRSLLKRENNDEKNKILSSRQKPQQTPPINLSCPPLSTLNNFFSPAREQFPPAPPSTVEPIQERHLLEELPSQHHRRTQTKV